MKTNNQEKTSRRNMLKTVMAVPTIVTFSVSELRAEGSGHPRPPRHDPPRPSR